MIKDADHYSRVMKKMQGMLVAFFIFVFIVLTLKGWAHVEIHADVAPELERQRQKREEERKNEWRTVRDKKGNPVRDKHGNKRYIY